jgi:nucleoside-diphosphate-sugar epimerase
MEAAPIDWAGRSVLVAGCTGFLGGAVIRELLQRGAKVIGLVRERSGAAQYISDIAAGRFQVVHGRVEDSARIHATMAVHEVSAIFYCAKSDPGLDAVMRAATIYHPRISLVTAKPTRPLRIARLENQSSLLVGVARFGELFGPRFRDLSQIIPRSILSLLRDETIQPTHGASRDFVFIRDAARACLLVAEAIAVATESQDHIFQTGWTFNDSTMSGMVSAALSGKGSEPKVLPPSNPLGWNPHIGLTAALAETIGWCRQFAGSNQSRENDSLRSAA